MIGQETSEIERKISAILTILSESPEPLGGRIISQKLKNMGIILSERAVRYHLKLMDERGLTQITGRRDGRQITQPGLEELSSALVWDKLGFLPGKIEMLSCLTNFDLEKNTGNLPVDVCLIPENDFTNAMGIMADVFKYDFCPSDLVAVAHEGERLGDLLVPPGKIGLATICDILVHGLMLKLGIPVDARFEGLLEVKNYKPVRFTELIEYSGTTLPPSEIFATARRTNLKFASKTGSGKVIASYYEFPMISKPEVETLLNKLKDRHLCRAFVIGRLNETVCKVPLRVNRIGLVVYSSLNAAAAAAETGIDVVCKAMCGLLDFTKLKRINDLKEIDV
jgi:repressor of nif and glnA expression